MKIKMHHLVTFFVILFLAVTSSNPVSAQDAPVLEATPLVESANGVYLVQMVDEPVIAYTGTISSYKATAPEAGAKIDPLSSQVTSYVSYLVGKHDKALKKAGGGQKLYDYVYTYNGFAAKLTATQAKKLSTLKNVKIVTPDELQTMDTSSTPAFLGLNAPGGLWELAGGVKNAGEGIIIGMVDSGIWPESLSFTDRLSKITGLPAAKGKLVYQQIPGWHGKCVPGEAFVASLCNQKLIGGQYFNAAWGGNAGIESLRPWEFTSVRDYNGHGTHTASTAGGNASVLATGPTEVFGMINGMAPRARIAMYKALWSTEAADTASGYTSDLVAAIDQAVKDGVDVISYSISGSRTNFLDPVMVSFLYAARAGIFVATSAGNSGPVVSTVAHPGPWVTTVAASTHNRGSQGSVTLGDGTTYYGPSLAAAPLTAPLIDSEAAGIAGADPVNLSLCYSSLDGGNLLDPAKVAGKIVVCDRGVTARVNKSYAVMEAGGVGMILINPTANSLNADFHSVPTVHLANTDRAAVKAYAAMDGATATINVAVLDYTTPAPFIASFSSRGPLLAGNGDLLKPDLTAPGVDILAAVSPASGGGLNFNLYSGTSMSTPHVAGVAALLMQLHPDWTPMMIKSALMTSAYDILDGPNTHPLVIFRQGAGHIQPNSAVDPGLVYDAGWNDWLAFLCGTTTGIGPKTCTALESYGYSFDPSDLNVASIAIGDLAGVQTVIRTVTNVGEAATYTASVTGLAGFDVMVEPSTLTLGPGESGTFTVTITRIDAALMAYTGGYLTWSDGVHNVRIPMIIKPVALAAPTEVTGSYEVTFGYTGAFSATPRGLVPAETIEDTISDGEMLGYAFVIPAGTTYMRASLFDEYVTPGSDLDLYLVSCDAAWECATEVAYSGSGTSKEEVNAVNPAPGNYAVFVEGYATANPSSFTLFAWVLDGADAGNMIVTAPASAILGETGMIDLSFVGLLPGTKYLGSIAYDGAAGLPNPTIVRVDTP